MNGVFVLGVKDGEFVMSNLGYHMRGPHGFVSY